tara:strand:- start:27 stop:362 length:336 start_codon:yes stop_codon:yes gene_type:complete
MAYRENGIYNGVFNLGESEFTVSSSVDVYGLNTASTAITANLPAVATVPKYKAYTFKDTGNNASSNNITIDGAGTQKIDGQNTYVIDTNGEAVTIVSDGGAWLVISRYVAG